MPEVARYEPRAALDGGSDGFAAFPAAHSNAAQDLMAPTGIAVLEFGPGQFDTIAGLGRDGRHDCGGHGMIWREIQCLGAWAWNCHEKTVWQSGVRQSSLPAPAEPAA